MSRDELIARIKQFVIDNFLLGEDEDQLEIEGSLLEQGVLDSTGVIELVSFVEEEYGIEVPDQDVVPDHFGSISGLAAYILQRKEAA
jgi:acyl carrier protein